MKITRKITRTDVAVLCSPLVLLAGISALPTAAADDTGDTAGDAASVVVNEVESDGDEDWVELANTDAASSVDVSGWTLLDDDTTHTPLTLPEGTEIESGGYLVVPTEPSFGLGGTDAVTLADASGTVVDTTSWSGHAATTWGRVPDMTGDFAVTGEPTPGARNVADGEDASTAVPWPDDPMDVTDTVLTGEYAEDFTGEDMSGVDIAPDGTTYVVNNDQGTLYVLTPVAGQNAYSVDSRHQLRYPDGTGLPDAEGVTLGSDGALIVSTERDNSDGKDDTSRPSVLRFAADDVDGGDGDIVATDEWNLSEFTGELSANGGLETVSRISGTGEDALFAVGVEDTGEVLFVDLSGTEPTLVQRYESPFEGVMASDYDEESGELRILCDEACDGESLVLAPDASGTFAPVGEVTARPAAMANLANEGYARGVDADGTVRYLWADDGATDGVGLRGAVVTSGSPAGSVSGSAVLGS